MENLTVKLFNEIAEKQLPGLALFENRTGFGKTTCPAVGNGYANER